MNILSFVFGMLAVLGLLAIVALIAGIVKINKIGSDLESTKLEMADTNKSLFDDIQSLHSDLETEIKNVISYIDSRIDKALLK